MWFVVLSILALIVLLGLLNISKLKELKRQLEVSKIIQGPSVKELIENTRKEYLLEWFKECQEKYGPIFRIWIGNHFTVFISDPDDIHAILNNPKNLEKSHNYQFMRPWLGRGLVLNSGESWRKMRKLLTPAFNFQMLLSFKQSIDENCKILISKLNYVADSANPVDIHPYITLYTLDVIYETAMGLKKNVQNGSEPEYLKALKTMLHVVYMRSFSLLHRFTFTFRWTSLAKEYYKALQILHNETWRVIKLRRKLLNQNDEADFRQHDDACDTGIKRRYAFLDNLLITQKNDNTLTDLNIREEVDTFLSGGHDTIASTLSVAAYLLSHHPEAQKLAYEEAVEYEGREMETMKYLEAVIKETMRLYSPAPIFSRLLEEEAHLKNVTIPKGSTAYILAHLLHRNPKIYPDPDKFKPERFMGYLSNTPSYGFVAFGAGPRNCIGQKFAMLEIKCALGSLLRNFEFLPVDHEIKTAVKVVLAHCNGVFIKIKTRQI